MQISVARDVFQLAQVFTISRGSRTQAEVLTVTVEADGVRGVGECVPYARYGETLESLSRRYGISLPVLSRLNHFTSPDELYAYR